MKRYLLLMICLIGLSGQAFADRRPPWLRGIFPKQSNQTYYFKTMQGYGANSFEARQNAIAGLIGDVARSQGVTVQGTDIMKTLSQNRNGRIYEHSSLQSTYRLNFDTFDTAFEIVDEYEDRKGYYLFFEVAHNPERVAFDKIELTADYKGAALWRSMIIPGWGQMYKRSTGKGLTILALEAVSAVGIVVCHNQSNSYYNKALVERNMNLREAYQDKSTTYRHVRNGCIAAAGAIYIWNIVDALTAKGAKRYKRVRISPYADDTAQGMAFNMSF